MKSITLKKVGATVVVLVSLIYTVVRIIGLIQNFGYINASAVACELTLLALVCVETSLMATKVAQPARKPEASALIESAKSVLFTTNNIEIQQSAGGSITKTSTTKIVGAGNFGDTEYDAIVFAEDSTLEELHRCFLSLDLLEDISHVYVIDSTLSPEREALVKEFSFYVAEFFHNIVATTEEVLICRGTDILFPDALNVARTYERQEDTFLELRSVYSDERALGINGIIDISDKRQMIREALSTRSLSTWSTGPALVNAKSLENSVHATSAAAFFGACERTGIHGQLTEEIISEEISHEQTISEVEWRALDFKYSAAAWKNSYKTSGTKMIGLGIKTWSAMINASFIRRIAAIALVLLFVIAPARFSFVTIDYITVAGVTIAAIMSGSYLAGDRRGIFSRIREYYFDVEAVLYNIYKVFIKPEKRSSDKSIVKKLPSVSTILVVTDAILVYRVYRQHIETQDSSISHFLKYVSMFSGYTLIVSLLIGLGMVIIRQSRSAMRREISRGANLDAEPVSLVDLSPGGAGCISVNPLDVGQHLMFESSLPWKTGNTKFQCDAIVRSCVPWNDSFRVGIEFVELDQKHRDILETYCSIIYPYEQARQAVDADVVAPAKIGKINGKAEKRFLSYVASFVALGAIIFSNLSNL